MPTYDYKCDKCSLVTSVFQSMTDYSRFPIRPCCPEHGQMERMLSVVPAMSGLANALAGDRHYEGMRAPDGTDIGSRTKHRNYMKEHGLTTADDFKNTWAEAKKKREEYRTGTFKDNELRTELTKAVMTEVSKTA